ncbi:MULTISPECIES: hypothetical protein [Agrobacterium]|uniref:hypothetical protein n=1 Tax=Agrobacterium TaxID=357 RepID=UPI001FA97943|nr:MULTISPECIES: hypothetical protein [Agrobacterium]UNZ49318.1 hypothetical protein MLE07_07925 [Agrobacterium tumefaciens]
MKTWQAFLISASLITGGLLASARPGLTDVAGWVTVSGLGGFFYNPQTKEMIWCEVKGARGNCGRVTGF